MNLKPFIFALAIILAGTAALIYVNTRHHVYTVGIITNLEGKNAQVGIDAVKSVKLAYDKFKKNNKTNFDVDFISIDNGFDPEKTVKAYSILKDKTKFFIFGTTTTSFMSIYDDFTANKNHLCFATIGSTKIKNIDDNVLKNILDVDDEQKSISDYMTLHKMNNILIVREIEKNPQYTEMAVEAFKKYYKGKYEEIYFSGAELRIDNLKNRDDYGNFDSIYIISGTNSREVGLVVQTIYNVNSKAVFITLPWGNDEIFSKALGKSIQNVVFTSPVNENDEKYALFLNEFKDKEGYTPHGPFNNILYDDILILLEAINKTGTDNPKKLKKYILNNKFTGTNGEIQFNKYGDIQGKLYFTRFNPVKGIYEISD